MSPKICLKTLVCALLMAATYSWTSLAQEQPAQSTPPDTSGAKPDEIVVASWGGAYAQSQERAFFSPFKADSGIAVRAANHEGKASDALKDNAGKWDVVDLSAAAARKACEDGLLVKIDPSALPAASDGSRAAQDYLPGALTDCGVGSVAWSSAIAFDTQEFKKAKPSKAADVFDLKGFPGKRGLPKGPRYLFELALVAAGVPASEIYKTLGTDAGLEKAFAELDKIAAEIVWWESPGQPLELLADGKVDMALAFNGRIFASIVGDNQPFGVIWDGQVYDMDMWAIPKSSTNTKAALDFVAFASRPERMAAQTQWFPYGPLRKSSIALVGKHAEIDVDMSAYLPTSPDNFANAVQFDARFWAENEDRIAKRLDEWRTARAEEDKAKSDDAKKADDGSE